MTGFRSSAQIFHQGFFCSSEGWHESSSEESHDEEEQLFQPVGRNYKSEGALINLDSKPSSEFQNRGSSRSIVLLEVGRETVETWAKFAKKASI